MAKAKKRRTKKRRQAVNRGERVAATPETLRKLKPCNLAHWLRVGPEGGGLTAAQHDDLQEIVEAWSLMTQALGYGSATIGEVSGRSSGDMSDGEARLWSIWLDWAREFRRRTLVRGYLIAEMVRENGDLPAHFLPLLSKAADLWDEARNNHDRARRTERSRRHTIAGVDLVCH